MRSSDWKERIPATRQAAVRALVAAGDAADAGRGLLRALGEGLAWDAGIVWRPGRGGARLVLSAFWSRRPVAAFEAAARRARPGSGRTLAGRVWRTGRPAGAAEAPGRRASAHVAAAARSGLHACAAFPARAGAEVVAVVEFYTVALELPDPELLEVLGPIGDQLGLLLARDDAGRQAHVPADWLVRAAADAIVTLDDRGIIRSANPAAERLFGWTRNELEGRPLGRLLSLRGYRAGGETPRDWLERLAWRSAQRGASTVRGRRRDGVAIALEISVGALKRAGDHRFVAVLRDVSTRLARSRQLGRSTSVLESAVVGLNIQRDQAEAGREQAEAARREAESARREAESAREEAEAARKEAVRAARWSSFLAESGRALATSLDREDALRVLASLAVPAIADLCIIDLLRESGEITRVQVTYRDVAERDRVVAFLRRHPPRPTAHVGPPAVIRSGEPVLLHTVEAADLRLFARSEAALPVVEGLGISSVMIVPLVARGRTLGAITLARAHPGQHYDTGDLGVVEALAGRAALAVSNADLYEQALSANRARSNFLAIMSHELRTPLTAIMGYADILQAGIAGELLPRQREYLERVMVSARHLLALIDEILTFTRLEVGRERTRYTRLSLRDFARETANLVRPSMLEKQLRFEVRLPPEGAVVETDPEKVRQVLLDILLNAVKFTPQGRIILETRLEDGSVVFDIRDTGIGISATDLPHVFEPFWQAEEAMTRREGGTGIGLAVARRLTRLLGGDIEASSLPGRGTLFRVRIPQHAPDPGMAAA